MKPFISSLVLLLSSLPAIAAAQYSTANRLYYVPPVAWGPMGGPYSQGYRPSVSTGEWYYYTPPTPRYRTYLEGYGDIYVRDQRDVRMIQANMLRRQRQEARRAAPARMPVKAAGAAANIRLRRGP